MTYPTISIRYRRLPDRLQVFHQRVLERGAKCVITFLESAVLPKPVRASGRVVLEPGSPVIWFTYPGAWYDVGRFHLADGTFTGTYANVLTPVIMHPDGWETTDLCLDIWKGADGSIEILDEDEFASAVEHGWIDGATADRVKEVAEDLIRGARDGSWPDDHVEAWTLERVRKLLNGGSGT